MVCDGIGGRVRGTKTGGGRPMFVGIGGFRGGFWDRVAVEEGSQIAKEVAR